MTQAAVIGIIVVLGIIGLLLLAAGYKGWIK